MDLPHALAAPEHRAPGVRPQALAVVLAIGAWHAQAARPGRHDLLAAGAVLAVSLTFRTVDPAVCPAFPLGTHFLWHLLNGLVLYLAARPLVLRPGSAAPA